MSDLYDRRPHHQRDSLYRRLRRRRLTGRVLVAYTAAVAVVVFADPWPGFYMGGFVLVAAGTALRIWTFGHLQKNQRLATTGPYAHTRNPAYVGSALIVLGLVLAAGNPATLNGRLLWLAGAVGLAMFFFVYLPRKYRREYPQLARLFPTSYPGHAANVPNFFPRLKPWYSGDSQRFAWACVALNNEGFWPLACIGGLALMLI